MPIKPCQRKGKRGYRWGRHGKCYTGKGARKKAARQAAAIRASGWVENAAGVGMTRIDPSRTKTLRDRFERAVSVRFDRLKRKIIQLIEVDDALGLKEKSREIADLFSTNVFCPTGEGGGIDPTCSPGGGKGGGGLRTSLIGEGDAWIDEKTFFGNTTEYPPDTRQVEKGIRDLEDGEGTYTTVPIRGLTPTQDWTGADKVKGIAKEWDDKRAEPIEVLEYKGKRYIMDGHHTAAAALYAGKDTVKARVVGDGSYVENVFCPTGEGGGIDPHCSPGGGKATFVSRSGEVSFKGGTSKQQEFVKSTLSMVPAKSWKDSGVTSVVIHDKPFRDPRTGKVDRGTIGTHDMTRINLYPGWESDNYQGARVILHEYGHSLENPATREKFQRYLKSHNIKEKFNVSSAEKGSEQVGEMMADSFSAYMRGYKGGASGFYVERYGKPVRNVFCPTGEGGGIDPTCSPGGGKSPGKLSKKAPPERPDDYQDMTDSLKDHCKQISEMFQQKGVESVVNEHGQTFKGSYLPKDIKRGPVKLCFENSLKLAGVHEEEGWKYVEGFATSPKIAGIPIHHAWVIDSKGKVIDPTWDNPEEASYFGVPIKPSDMWDYVTTTGTYGLSPWKSDVKLPPVANVFCPTGPGGGVDPTCSPGGGHGGSADTGPGAKWAAKADVPNEPGTTPIPENHVRLYHFTKVDESTAESKHQAAENLRKGGVDIGKAVGSSYGEPNVVWVSTEKPPDTRVYAEFSIAVDDPRWGLNKPDKSESPAEYMKKKGDAYLKESVKPDELIAVHEPWHRQYRYMVKNDLIGKAKAGEFDRLLSDEDYGPAVRKAKAVTANVFCPTGPGGGVDPHCSPAGGLTTFHGTSSKYLRSILKDGIKPHFKPGSDAWARRRKWGNIERANADIEGRNLSVYVAEDASEAAGFAEFAAQMSMGLPAVLKVHIPEGEVLKTDEHAYGPAYRLERDIPPSWIKAVYKVKGGDLVRVKKSSIVKNVAGYTYYLILILPEEEPAQNVAGETSEWQYTWNAGAPVLNPSANADGESDAPPRLVSNDRWRFLTDDEKLEQFRLWLQNEIQLGIIGTDSGVGTPEGFWDEYIQDGYRKGVGRAFDDAQKAYAAGFAADKSTAGFYVGTKEEFLRHSFARPVSKQRLKMLAARTFTDLSGISKAMETSITRVLTDGLVQGQHPYDIARRMTKEVDGIGRRRAKTLARTEIIRAHAEGQLQALEEMGVEEIGVMVEWSTSKMGLTIRGYPSPCELCAPMQGTVFKLKEARGLIPRHPNCMCAFKPANVGESRKEQIRGKIGIEQAIIRSVKAEVPIRGRGSKKKRTLPQRLKRSRWIGIDKRIAKNRPKSVVGIVTHTENVFCPTGPGGGIDPHCSPGGAKAVSFESRSTESFSPDDQETVKSAISKAQSSLGSNAPEVKRVIVDPALEERGTLATKSNDAIYCNPRMTQPAEMEKLHSEWDGLMIGNCTVESTITHEYGHMAERKALNTNEKAYRKEIESYVTEEVTIGGVTARRWEIDTLGGRSFYAQEDYSEWVAEAFADAVLNGDKAHPSSKELHRRLSKVLG